MTTETYRDLPGMPVGWRDKYWKDKQMASEPDQTTRHETDLCDAVRCLQSLAQMAPETLLRDNARWVEEAQFWLSQVQNRMRPDEAKRAA